jgi:hypothetical protein
VGVDESLAVPSALMNMPDARGTIIIGSIR